MQKVETFAEQTRQQVAEKGVMQTAKDGAQRVLDAGAIEICLVVSVYLATGKQVDDQLLKGTVQNLVQKTKAEIVQVIL